jgi:DNA-binding LytR/AlgR family response regulator
VELKILFINFETEEVRDCNQYLKDNLKMKIDCQISSIEEYERKMLSTVPELVFIEIDLKSNQLPLHEITGKIKAYSESIGIVWVAGGLDQAGAAFDMEINDYIVRPFEQGRLLKPIFRLLKKKAESLPEIVSVWETDRFVVLRPEQIVYCYTTDRKTAIKTKDGEYSSMDTLTSFKQRLEKYRFFRTHKSFLVNQNYIKEVIPWFNHTYNLVMHFYEHDEVPVSRTYLKEFKQRMGIE